MFILIFIMVDIKTFDKEIEQDVGLLKRRNNAEITYKNIEKIE